MKIKFLSPLDKAQMLMKIIKQNNKNIQKPVLSSTISSITDTFEKAAK